MMQPPDLPVSIDPIRAIEVAIWDALSAAWKVRARRDLSPGMMVALVLEEARKAASPPLNQPGLNFTTPDVARALADALGRWAAAATAASPEFGSHINACPGEPEEGAFH